MRLDLHAHSRASDGSWTLAELLAQARAAGFDSIALTDHDYTGHLDEAVRYGRAVGLTVIPGVEISAANPATGATVHILGYHLSAASPAVTAFCQPILQQRHQTSLRAVAALRELGFPLDLADIEAIARGAAQPGSLLDRCPVYYRQHVAQALRQSGVDPDRADRLIKDLYAPGGPCYQGIAYPDALLAVQAIQADGGLAVLAHPGLSQAWDMVPALAAAGLDGIEQNHPAHTESDRQQVVALCAEFELLRSGGSDSHGSNGDEPPPGTCRCPADQVIYFQQAAGRELWFAENLVRSAGNYLRSRRSAALDGPDQLGVQHKSGDHRDLVSECDLIVDHLVRSKVQALWPDDVLLTEEGSLPVLSDSARVWILDPVDGTTNFLHSGRDYTVSLALWSGRQPVFGLVYDVVADCLYRGLPGGGFFANGVTLPPRPPRQPSGEGDPLNQMVLDASINTIATLMGRGVDIEGLAKRLCGHRSLGCASLAIVRIALGESDAFVSGKLRVWDWAAAVIMLAETGGVWSGLQGQVVDPHDTSPTPFLAAADPACAQALLECLDCAPCIKS